MLLIGRSLDLKKVVFSIGFQGITLKGPVAQLVRASPCHGEGRRFESDLGRSYKKMRVFIYTLKTDTENNQVTFRFAKND